MSDPDPFLARLALAPLRHNLSLALIFALAGVFFYLGLGGQVHAPLGQMLLVALAAAALMLALRSYRNRSASLTLTRDGLSDADGHLLVAMDQIKSVDRGAFAFKPSNGFVLRLHNPARSVWVPGLYWLVGTRMGVGGTVHAAEARFMADWIGILLADRPGAQKQG